jgi:hypothetical protein
MLRHACGYKLANEGVGTPHDPGLSGAQVDPAYGALHRARADTLQGAVAGLE